MQQQRELAGRLRGDVSAAFADEAAWLDYHAELAEIDWSSPLSVIQAAWAFAQFKMRSAIDWKGTGPDSGTSPFEDLRDIRPGERDEEGNLEWVAGTGTTLTSKLAEVEAYSSPYGWASEINSPGPDTIERQNNCLDCARAVESTWRGSPMAAAGNEGGDGALAQHAADWTGGTFVNTSYDDIEEMLQDLGPGASAIVTNSWGDGRGGHAYNAINNGGTITFVDGQSGGVTPWPPTWEDPVYDVAAIVIDSRGKPVV